MRKRLLREKHTQHNYTDYHIEHDLNMMTGDTIHWRDGDNIIRFYITETVWKVEKLTDTHICDKVTTIHYVERITL